MARHPILELSDIDQTSTCPKYSQSTVPKTPRNTSPNEHMKWNADATDIQMLSLKHISKPQKPN